MQFVTVREPKEGWYHYRVSGGWPFYGPFRFRVLPATTTEQVAAVATAAADSCDFASVLRFINNLTEGLQNGADDATGRLGKRLCCVRVEVMDMKSHETATTADWMWLQSFNFVRELLERDATPIPPLRAEWLTSDVLALARGIHANAALDGIPALTDALIEAGCDDPLVIEHLQTCPDHGPSCWVVEMILDSANLRASG
jgi:hypothetical protein